MTKRPARAAARGQTHRAPRTSARGKSASLKKPHTPLFRAALAVSLDGYIARKDGDVAWLNDWFTPEIDFAGFMKTIGATVFGRTTFDEALARKQPFSTDPGSTIVLTHRAIPGAGNPSGPLRAVEPFKGDVRELADRLRKRLAGTGKDIWLIGGGKSINVFHEANLVDRWELSIIPVLLGDGIPLFPRATHALVKMRLTHHRALKNGIVEVHYERAA